MLSPAIPSCNRLSICDSFVTGSSNLEHSRVCPTPLLLLTSLPLLIKGNDGMPVTIEVFSEEVFLFLGWWDKLFNRVICGVSKRLNSTAIMYSKTDPFSSVCIELQSWKHGQCWEKLLSSFKSNYEIQTSVCPVEAVTASQQKQG